MKKIKICILSLFSVISLQLFAAATPEENKIVQELDGRVMTDGMAFLKKTVEINSGTLNRKGVEAVGKLYEERLAKLGFKITWIDLASLGRGFHLFAERTGAKESPHLLLMGHMDTVFEPDSGFWVQEKISESRIKGPGISDMKSGNLVILESLEALQRSGDLEKMNVIVAFTGDEESPGLDPDGSTTTTRKPLVEAAARSDLAISFETAINDIDHATINRRGASRWFLKLSAKGGHSSQIFRKNKGAGAIFAMTSILDRFYRELRKEKYLTYNVGNISGGVSVSSEKDEVETKVAGKVNVIPGQAQAVGDLRFIDNDQNLRVRKKMQKIVEDSLKAFNKEYAEEAAVKAEITFKDQYPSFAPTKGNRALLKVLSQVSLDLGYGSVGEIDPMDRGAGDISFVAGKAKAGLDGLGPLGFDFHSKNETMAPESLPVAVKRATIFLRRLANNTNWRSTP